MEKKILVSAFLLLFISQGLHAQLSYLGLSTQKLSTFNPHLRIKQDSLYVPPFSCTAIFIGLLLIAELK